MLRQFRAGDLNCLVSTSVAEEGLDVRQCQLVIRHDLPSTLLAFIQSRGRARMAASDMVLMVDQSKPDELQFLDDALRYTFSCHNVSQAQVAHLLACAGTMTMDMSKISDGHLKRYTVPRMRSWPAASCNAFRLLKSQIDPAAFTA